MGVIHILADGTKIADITGHVVKADEAVAAYQLMRSINQRAEDKNHEEKAHL